MSSYPKDIYLAVGRDATRVEKFQLERIDPKNLWLAYTAKSEAEELAFKAGIRAAIGGEISHCAFIDPESVAMMQISYAKNEK